MVVAMSLCRVLMAIVLITASGAAVSAQVTPAAGYTPPDDTPSIRVGTTLFPNYTFQSEPETVDADGNTIPGFGTNHRSSRHFFSLNETHMFGSAMVNEARFGFNRLYANTKPTAELNPAEFGILNGISQPIGLPQISIAGSLNLGGPSALPSGRGDTTFVVADTLSRLFGRFTEDGKVMIHKTRFSRLYVGFFELRQRVRPELSAIAALKVGKFSDRHGAHGAHGLTERLPRPGRWEHRGHVLSLAGLLARRQVDCRVCI